MSRKCEHGLQRPIHKFGNLDFWLWVIKKRVRFFQQKSLQDKEWVGSPIFEATPPLGLPYQFPFPLHNWLNFYSFRVFDRLSSVQCDIAEGTIWNELLVFPNNYTVDLMWFCKIRTIGNKCKMDDMPIKVCSQQKSTGMIIFGTSFTDSVLQIIICGAPIDTTCCVVDLYDDAVCSCWKTSDWMENVLHIL